MSKAAQTPPEGFQPYQYEPIDPAEFQPFEVTPYTEAALVADTTPPSGKKEN